MVQGVFDYAEHAERWQFVELTDQPTVAFDQIDLKSIDGLLMSVWQTQQAKAIIDAGVAAVNISNLIEAIDLPRVANDDHATGRLGAEHLLERGFTEFGFIEHAGAWFSVQRSQAFRHTLQEDAGRDCHVLTIQPGKLTRNPGPLRRWLKQVPKPIAIMAATDHIARHTIDTAIETGLRVPDDLAVLGVDNYQWLSTVAAVPMSSIEPDWQQIGYRAAEMLDGLMAGEIHDRPRWIMPRGVVHRRSTDIALADDPLVIRALAFIRDHCSEGIHVDDVLDQLGISRRNLEYRLKRATGLTPQTAIFRAQIEKAKRLLAETDRSIGQVAYDCGFPQQARLNHLFKRLVGMTPSQFRRQRSGRPLHNPP